MAISAPQKSALKVIKATGTAQGIAPRTLETLLQKKHAKQTGEGYELTKRGHATLEGRLGQAFGEHTHFGSKTRSATSQTGRKMGAEKRKKRDRETKQETRTGTQQKAAEAAEQKHQAEAMAATASAAHEKAAARILGPTGTARAVKIARADGKPLDRADVEGFRAAGWQVTGASSAAPRPGMGYPGILAEEEEPYRNPEPLSETGTARALVLLGGINRATLDSLAAAGLDLSAAPKRLREAPTKNPSTAAKKAAKKAAAWFQKDSLTTEPKPLKGWTPPDAAIEIGEIVAIEYESNKFDGKNRIYRHEITRHRKMLISTDGQTIIVLPGLKITKRGIEG